MNQKRKAEKLFEPESVGGKVISSRKRKSQRLAEIMGEMPYPKKPKKKKKQY